MTQELPVNSSILTTARQPVSKSPLDVECDIASVWRVIRGCGLKGLLVCATLISSSGCGDTEPAADTSAAPPVMEADGSDEPEIILPSALRRKLKANEQAQFERVGNEIVEARLFQSGVKSIEALKGLPLRFLDLGMTEVTDLSPIKGMPLKSLILENTSTSDLAVLEGMQLEVLHLQNTKVTDLSVLKGMPIQELNLMNVPIKDLIAVADLPLQTLWIPGTQVTDISPLQGRKMVSIDVQDTQVTSLAPLAEMTTLRRLNIAGTKVEDLSPLKGLQLERITLTPETIKSGIDVLRDMPSLGQILTSMEGPRQSAGEFWTKYDAGVWSPKPEPSEEDEKGSDADAETSASNQDSDAAAGDGSAETTPNGDEPGVDDAGSNEDEPGADANDSTEQLDENN